jgi:diadenosine tetraphosphate (Ap4A) HIT family hydrolase
MTPSKRCDSDCFICRKHGGQISIPGGAIYEDDLIYVGHAQIPDGQTSAYLGYLMLEPQRHVPGLADLTNAEAQALDVMVARLIMFDQNAQVRRQGANARRAAEVLQVTCVVKSCQKRLMDG